MFKKKKTYAILVLIIVIFGFYFYKKSQKPLVSYTTQKSEKGNLLRTVSVTGEIKAPVEIDLSFKISGQITSLLVDVGDRVEKGQKIATIDKGTLISQLAQARHNADTQKRILSEMKNHKDTYTNLQKEEQRERIKAYEEAANQIIKQISETTLYSPISGTVIKKNVEVGEMTVANAVTSNTAVVTVASDGELLTEVTVPESDIVEVKLGQSAKVSLDALSSDEKLSAKVTEIEPASTVIQDVVYYKVKLAFDKPDSRLRIGMSTDVDINTAERNDVVMIPQRAIKSENGQDYVEILNPDGKTTQKINIQTGLKGDDGMIEVTGGLSEGEDVVVLQQ